jgi:hypothetical protein
MRRSLVLACAAILLAVPALAVADGDPASDVLLGQEVFLPYNPLSQGHQRELYSIAHAAAGAGFPVKIALIGASSDLGVVPGLFGKPAAYARFLSSELAGVFDGPVLVVMPSGFGLAAHGHARATNPLDGIAIGAGADGLATAALAATHRLAAAAGRPLPAGVDSRVGSQSGADPDTIRHALTAISVLVLLTALAVAGALTARTRRSRQIVRR